MAKRPAVGGGRLAHEKGLHLVAQRRAASEAESGHDGDIGDHRVAPRRRPGHEDAVVERVIPAKGRTVHDDDVAAGRVRNERGALAGDHRDRRRDDRRSTCDGAVDVRPVAQHLQELLVHRAGRDDRDGINRRLGVVERGAACAGEVRHRHLDRQQGPGALRHQARQVGVAVPLHVGARQGTAELRQQLNDRGRHEACRRSSATKAMMRHCKRCARVQTVATPPADAHQSCCR